MVTHVGQLVPGVAGSMPEAIQPIMWIETIVPADAPPLPPSTPDDNGEYAFQRVPLLIPVIAKGIQGILVEFPTTRKQEWLPWEGKDVSWREIGKGAVKE